MKASFEPSIFSMFIKNLYGFLMKLNINIQFLFLQKWTYLRLLGKKFSVLDVTQWGKLFSPACKISSLCPVSMKDDKYVYYQQIVSF